MLTGNFYVYTAIILFEVVGDTVVDFYLNFYPEGFCIETPDPHSILSRLHLNPVVWFDEISYHSASLS